MKKQWARAVLVRVIPLWLGFVFRTNRWHRDMPRSVAELIENRAPVIWCFWHGRMLLMPGFTPRDHKVYILISRHRDGRLISDSVARMRLFTVTGSSSKGARGATLTLMRLLRAGDSICITPDGPRGPRMRARKGAVALAALSGAPVIPVSCSASRAKFGRSWDRMLIPWPFGRAHLAVGEPIYLPKRADDDLLAAARRQLEDQLNALSAAADRACGHQPIEPDMLADEAMLDDVAFDAPRPAPAA